MIYVTCGHEKGIGLEVFLKSYSLLQPSDREKFKLICNEKVLNETRSLTSVQLHFYCSFVEKRPYSTSALDQAMSLLSENDILVTMPTSKDQLFFNHQNVVGHTEYFRNYFNKNVSMFFKSDDANVLLITDHVPLKELSDTITSELIEKQVETTINDYTKYFNAFENVYFAGLNPHAGEDGLLGLEEIKLRTAIKNLKAKFKKINFSDFLPADSMLINNKFSKENLFVYLYHDQALTPFKTLFKTQGANISLGLPFLRLSVDHGTAFDLYGKNVADYMGSYYVLKLALKAHRKSNEE
ncbi:MAG: 4-hydroxythreonine-4-phosphate dehydrogenase PdxA [Bdellovibrionota bacterium]|nr:4-hydroxythreonine-4-phosphate dehydrogenase PdxA [Bdellovibrionota bacterium]